jgi:hypothetical protein
MISVELPRLVRAEVVDILGPPVCSRYVDSCGRDRLRAVRIFAAAGLIVVSCALSCARNVPPPRGPGSVAVARFGQGEPTTRFRVLAEQTHGLDGPPRVAVAETASELGDLWRQYELVGAPPSVDFAQDLVLAFTEDGYCNDGRLEGFALTSAGELVPRVRRSPNLCVGGHTDCPRVRVYLAALGRTALPAGGYRLRWFGVRAFVVRSPGPAAAVASPSPPAPSAPPPPESDTRVPRHPRRASIVDDVGGDARSGVWLRSGVWVRSDAVWVPPPPLQFGGTFQAAEEDARELICDREACTRVLARTSCGQPECPANGSLLFGERALGVREPWPTEAAAWERLVSEIAGDPALGALIGGPQSFPRPGPARAPTIGWAEYRFHRGVELAANADYRRAFAGDAFLGAGVRAGWHFNWAVEDTTTQGKLFEPLVGDGWGIDLRLALMRPFAGDGSSGTGLRAGLGLSATNAIGLSTSESRVRVASLLGLLLPEVGVIRLPGESVRFSTTNALPISLLLSARLAIEVRPELSVLFGSGGPQGMLSLSLGFMWRTRQSICPDPPFVLAVDTSSCLGSPTSREDPEDHPLMQSRFTTPLVPEHVQNGGTPLVRH